MAIFNYTPQSDGTIGDVADINVPFAALAALLNAGLTLDNITPGSLDQTIFAADTRKGWTALSSAPNTVTNNGNRSYDLVFNSTDLTSIVGLGQRLRLTRSVGAPTQSTSLNGSTQYFSKATPNKLTFTDDFVVSAWVKLTSYSTNTQNIITRYNGTSGWSFNIQPSGQVLLVGYNGGAANLSYVSSYQSIPLNRWVYVAAQLDMSTFTATTTTSYVMIDGIDVAASVSRGGTNPTALIQAGNLEIGSWNGGLLPFTGKIAQAAVFNAKVTQATMRGYMSQGLAGTETSLASAYSFNNAITDLNTTTPNDLTANGSATATNADSPFANNDGGSYEYAIVVAKSFSTNTTLTVQVPEGCAIPTSGGVSAAAYSGLRAPFGFPGDPGKWLVRFLSLISSGQQAFSGSSQWTSTSLSFTVPVGSWRLGQRGTVQIHTSSSGVISGAFTLSATAPTNGSFTYPLTTRLYSGASTTDVIASGYADLPVPLTTATLYTLYAQYDSGSGTVTWLVRGDQGIIEFFADLGYV